jgi:hypothetical protein
MPLCLFVLVLLAAPAAAQSSPADTAGVRAAVLDYVEAIYDADPDRVERSVDPALAKTGFYRPRDAETYSRTPMTYDELVETAETWNDAGRDYSHVPRLIDVYDVLDQTASVRLVAIWGVDYMLLARVDGAWKVTHVLWQSHTPETLATLREAVAAAQADG